MSSKYLLNFLNKEEIEQIIDPTAYKVISYLINKTSFSQPEIKDLSEPTGIQVTKEFLESWISQACDLQKTGAGSYPIDVYKYGDFGADVKSVSTSVDKNGNLTKRISGESSLGQNFSDGEINLDTLFKDKNKDELLKKWKAILYEKYHKPFVDYEIKDFYYFIFIRAGNTVLLSIAKIEPLNLPILESGDFTKTSLLINNVLENKYGNAKIYKSKKRMELRLFAKNLAEDNLVISWNFNDHKPSIANLRELVQSGGLEKHQKSELKKFFNA